MPCRCVICKGHSNFQQQNETIFVGNLQFMTMNVCYRPKAFSPTKNLVFCHEISPTPHYWPDANGKPWAKNQAATIIHSKLLYQFVVSVEAYPYSKNQHHSSIQSWHIVDVVLRITFGRSRLYHTHINQLNQIDVFVYA